MKEAEPTPPPWRSPRKHLRVRLVTQVESQTSGQTCLGQTENISLGGILVMTRDTFDAETEVVVRFKLPQGRGIEVKGMVAHVKPGRQMGIQFSEMKDEVRKAIAEFVQEIKPYSRRSVRLARRFSLQLRWEDQDGNKREELVETVVLSRHGGMVLSPTSFKPGEDLYLWWPEQKRGSWARVVFRRAGSQNLYELGFEFVGTDNFWRIEFPTDLTAWEVPSR